MQSLQRILIASFGVLALSITAHSRALAQAGSENVVAGSVVEASTQRPLAGAQVIVEGTSRGTITDARGRFRIEALTGTEVTVQVQMLGFQRASQAVQLGNTNVTFELSQAAIDLDGIVVTGTAGGARQREVGNAVARVEAAQITEVAPVQSMSDLLTGRNPGVNFLPSSGNVGTGGTIKIRGSSSVTLGNQPLIYVDGVRIDNASNRGPDIRQGRQVNALDDINPNDIERIEIIKGPAAATLYGTEASGGVIQIITKRGQSGAPQFDLTIRQGGTWLANVEDKLWDTWWKDPATGELHSHNLYALEKAEGREIYSTGHLQTYGLSVRGGSDQIRYFASSEWDDNTGIVDYNWQKNLNLRGNITVLPSQSWTIDLSTGFVQGETRFNQALTNYGTWDQLIWGSPRTRIQGSPLRGFLRITPEEAAKVDSRRWNTRFIGSLTLRNNPSEWFSQRLVLGLDTSEDTNQILVPRMPEGDKHFLGIFGLGDKTLERPRINYNTLDYGATASYALGGMDMKTSAGVQYYHKETRTTWARGREFPAPPITTISGAAIRESGETYVENKSLGVFLQQELALFERLYLTAAVRGDDNSAFGSNFNAAIYPKFSAAYVLSDEPAFRNLNLDFVDQLRLRAAWGKAGRQPDNFASLRLYNPVVGPGNTGSAVAPQEIGNPDLGPEVGTELELGIEGAFFDQRLSIDLTHYNQRTNDAILERPVIPSSGFPGTQSVNVGVLSNKGWELSANGQLMQTPRFGWDMGLGLSNNTASVVDMGGLPQSGNIREGYPIPSIFYRRVLSADLDANGRAINILCDGGTGPHGTDPGGAAVPCGEAPEVYFGRAEPKWEMSWTNTLTILNDLQLYAMVEMRTGHHIFQQDISVAHYNFCVTEYCNKRHDPIFMAYMSGVNTGPLGVYDASFAKLRELSASYTLPVDLSERIGASRTSIQASWRNPLTLWVKEPERFGMRQSDPEMRTPGSDLTTASMTIIPPLSTFLLTMRLSF